MKSSVEVRENAAKFSENFWKNRAAAREIQKLDGNARPGSNARNFRGRKTQCEFAARISPEETAGF